MRRRIVKSRKRIKKTTGITKKEACGKKPDGMPPTLTGGALTVYERGEIIRNGPDPSEGSEDGNIQETPHTYVPPTEKRMDILRLVCGFVVIFSLFSAVVLACFAFAVATEHTADRDSIDAGADVEENTESGESGKVIFVRPDHSESGTLTAPELYEKCVKSAVTVTAKLSAEAGGGEGVGSGFVISEDGYIATACHVVSGAEKLTVVLSEGEEYTASLIAKDSLSDIALLKIDAAKKLSAVCFGASSELLTGERVYAIGTPAALDYAGTLSSGEVSCPERLVSVYTDGVKVLEKKLRLIQINAEVNKGNSGCPLFDEYGRVVGMVTMKLGAEYSGIGFAVPSDGLLPVLEAMKDGRELNSALLSGAVVMPPRLGISGETAEAGGIYGYRIDSITGNGSGAAGALKQGDLVLQIDTHIITKATDINEAIEKKTPGDTVSVTVLRSGQKLTFNIILGS